MKLNVVMPMGGGGTRFGNHGYDVPKPLIEIYEKPFFYWATQSLVKNIEVESLTFVVLQQHIDKFGIDNKIKEFYPKAKINVIPEVLPGAVLTCKAGVLNIENNQPIIFNDCDHLFVCKSFNEFCEKQQFDTIDGGLLTFKSNDPKFSFVAYDVDGYVNHTVEKQAISDDAICGAYYFKNKEIFEDAVQIYLENCAYSEFFVSGVYNVMAEQGKKIKSFNVDTHVSFGTPNEYELAKENKAYLQLL